MTLAELQSRLLMRLGDDPNAAPGFQHYTASNCTAALNQIQRLFVLMTLCLETTGTIPITGGTAFYSMLGQFADWLAPLRIRNSLGVKIKPCRLSDMAALDSQWSIQTGTSERYCLLGFDLMGIYKTSSTTLTATYARCPATMIIGTDTPDIPVRYHPALIDGAIPLMRVKEGQQEWSKTMPQWDRFMAEAAECAAKVRARNLEQNYDSWPIELDRFDRGVRNSPLQMARSAR